MRIIDLNLSVRDELLDSCAASFRKPGDKVLVQSLASIFRSGDKVYREPIAHDARGNQATSLTAEQAEKTQSTQTTIWFCSRSQRCLNILCGWHLSLESAFSQLPIQPVPNYRRRIQEVSTRNLACWNLSLPCGLCRNGLGHTTLEPPDQTSGNDQPDRDQLRPRQRAPENFATTRIAAQKFKEESRDTVEEQIGANYLPIEFLARQKPGEEEEIRQLYRRFKKLSGLKRMA